MRVTQYILHAMYRNGKTPHQYPALKDFTKVDIIFWHNSWDIRTYFNVYNNENEIMVFKTNCSEAKKGEHS